MQILSTMPILRSKNPAHSSYTWRSIAQSRDIIRRGSRWRIGNGENVSIWKDNWLTGSEHGRIIFPPSVLPADTNVAALIDPVLHRWRGNVIDVNFFPFEASIIKRMPLSQHHVSDSLTWKSTLTGHLTVKSAYTFLWNEQYTSSSNPSSSSTTNTSSFWKLLWSLLVPPKIRNFGWRACCKILPTLTNLFQKQILSTYTCYLCGEEAETVSHVLWSCPYAVRVWKSTPMFSSMPLGHLLDFQDVLDCAFNKLATPEMEIFITTAWMLWAVRNDVWRGKDPPRAEVLVGQAVVYATEFIEHNRRQGSPGENLRVEKWKRPPEGVFKVNIAESKFSECKMGFGVVVRDSSGQMLAALAEEKVEQGMDYGEWQKQFGGAYNSVKTLVLILSFLNAQMQL
jgi:hypothetical protein